MFTHQMVYATAVCSAAFDVDVNFEVPEIRVL